ncbi:target of Nesh-SH3 isoform X26 [Rattus norvegicus]|uniref:target of Nesh-SH3 isoform X26 n=1 Tax=Rattus norvegicus TaxID=10116 RepID=UPI002FD839C8
MLSSLGCLLLCGSIALALGNAQKLPKGKKPSLKVHINTTSDSVLLKFLRPNPNVKLEGFLLGYGSNVSPNQYFPLPTEGKFTEAVVDAEPKYLIVVRPAPPPSQKKSCSGKSRTRKPLQLVVGTLTPSSVFLSWGFLINPHHDWTLPSHCSSDRFYTIRYREKDKEKKWIFQLCPATETIVENLKPNTVYEFGVKDNIEGGIWSKIFNHKTIVGSKNKVNGKIQSTYDQVHSVPAYVPRKLIPITIIKQVIQNVTHRASTKSPDKIPFGGTILVHLIIPGLNDSTVKLPSSIMLEISDALKAQLAKNETLALPAESKTPEVEKVAGQPVTVTPETVSRSTKPTLASALDTAETALVLSEKTPETAQSVLIPESELLLSSLAPKGSPEFPEAKTAFPSEKPGGSLASSEEPWVVPGAKTSEDSRVVQPRTATYDVVSSSATSDETEVEPHTATSDPILDSVPPKTSRTAEQPRATLAPSEASFDPRTVEIFTSPEVRPTTAAPQQTTSIPSTPKRQSTPKPPRVKPAPEPETRPSAQSTKAPPHKTKKPGRRRPKTTRSPEVPKSKPALEPATVPPEILVPTIVPKPPQRPKATRRPEAPQIQPAHEPVTFGSEAPALAIVTTTDIAPVISRTKASVTTLAPKSSRPRTRQRPKYKATPSPKIPQTKPADLGPITAEPSLASTTKKVRRPRPKPKTTPHPEVPQTILVPATSLEPVIRTETPGTTLVPKLSQQPDFPHPKPKTTRSPAAPPTELVSTTVFEPVIPLKEDPVTTIVPFTDLEPATDLETPVAFRTEAPRTTLASKKSQRTRRPRPRPPKATLSPQAPKTKTVPAVVLEPVTLRPEVQVTTLAPKKTQIKHRPRPKPKPIPSPEVAESKPAPRQTTSPPPKLKPPHSRRPAKEQVPKDEQLSHKPDPEVSQSETVLPPVTFRVEPPKTTIVPLETRDIPLIPVISPRPSEEELQTTMEQTDQSTQELFTTKIPRTTELAKTTQAPHRLHTTPVRPRIPERPHGRPALNKTTTRPDRTKSRGMSHKNGVGPGTKQTPKPSSTGRNTSVDSHATRKPGLIPGTRHRHTSPRPVPPQRKPLPPNNVTGKPGSAGIISSSRATSPPLKATLKPTGTATERPGAEKKQPTAPASEEEFGNTTDFSSSPTKETDPLGKPRFIGPHVRYIPKPDNKPCSITDSVRRFPTEEATEGNATSPPQNPPTNLTVVTVEGCPSFVILDWEKPLNDTVTEYEVISRENGSFSGKNKSIQITNQTFSTVENLKPDTSYEFQVKPKNPLGEGPASNTVAFSTESADPRVSEPISAGRDAIWTERPFNSDSYSECKGKQYVKRTWYKKFVGVQLCNSLRYKIYLSDSLTGKFYNIGDQRGHGEDHCQFVDSFLDGRTGQQLTSDQLPTKEGYFRAVRQEPVQFGEIGGHTQINYVQWYECGTTIPGKW